MRPNFLLLLLLAGTPTLLTAQSDSIRELERSCTRMTDDPRPANLDAMQATIDRETGARASFLTGCRLIAEQKWGPAGKEFEKAVKAEPGVAVLLRLYWHRFMGIFSKKHRAQAEDTFGDLMGKNPD